MKRSTAVTVGLVLFAGMSMAGCTEGEEFQDQDADHQKVCVKPLEGGEYERRPEHECSNTEESGFSGCAVCWFYLGKAFGTPPAHGARFKPGTYGSFTKPSTGTFAVPPGKGGFGTTKVSVGG